MIDTQSLLSHMLWQRLLSTPQSTPLSINMEVAMEEQEDSQEAMEVDPDTVDGKQPKDV